LSLKIPALCISVILFTLLFVIACRYFGGGAAIATGLVFLFAPAHYLERSLLAFGNHVEVATFVASGLLIFLVLLQNAKASGGVSRAGLALLLGLNSGFAVFVMYDYLSFVIVLVLVYLAALRKWRFALLDGICFAAGFYVGLIPWMAFHHNFLVVNYFYHLLTEPPPNKVGSFNNFGLFVRAITINVADWFGSKDLVLSSGKRIAAGVFNAMFFVVFVGSYFYLAWRNRSRIVELLRGYWPFSRQPLSFTADHAILPLLIYVPLHLVVYGRTKYHGVEPLPPTRYLLVLMPVYFLLVAVAVRDLWRNKKRWLAAAALALIAAASLGGNYHYLQGRNPGEPMRRPGYSYQYFMEMFERQYPVRWKYEYQFAFGDAKFPNHEGDYTIGAAAGIAFLHGRRIDGHLRAAVQDGPPALAAFVAGLGIAPSCTDKFDPQRQALLQAMVPRGYESYFAIGQAQKCPAPWDKDL
jgi:hypothetical protein